MKKKILKNVINWITDIFVFKDPPVNVNKKKSK